MTSLMISERLSNSRGKIRGGNQFSAPVVTPVCNPWGFWSTIHPADHMWFPEPGWGGNPGINVHFCTNPATFYYAGRMAGWFWSLPSIPKPKNYAGNDVLAFLFQSRKKCYFLRKSFFRNIFDIFRVIKTRIFEIWATWRCARTLLYLMIQNFRVAQEVPRENRCCCGPSEAFWIILSVLKTRALGALNGLKNMKNVRLSKKSLAILPA